MQEKEIRLIIDSFYSIQHLRIEIGNRMKMLVRDYPEEVTEEKAGELHEMISGNLIRTEKEIEKRVRVFIKPLPLYQLWLKPHVKGIAELLGGALIAAIEDIGKFDTVSKLWIYCGIGLKPALDKEGNPLLDGDGNILYEIQRKKKGEKINYSPFLKTLCWKIGESFVKTGTRGFYGDMYKKYKERETRKQARAGVQIVAEGDAQKLRKEGKKAIGKAHIHNRARRKAVKLFLSHLWEVWREIEGLPTRVPYVIEHQPDTGVTHHYIDPPGWHLEKDKGD